MAKEKFGFEDFIQSIDENDLSFVQNLHDFMLKNGCKPTFEEKKSGLLGSYKHTKTKRSVINLLFRKKGFIVRIYGENIGEYPDFLNSLPAKMVESINGASICKRLVHNTCSPKCLGYDFKIEGKHFQKCRYNCFEFLVTNKSKKYIKSFVENETKARTTI